MFTLGRPPPPPRPRTPIPKFRHLKDPKKSKRAFAHRQDPFEGDFCVISIDHVASVAYLGPEAMEAAKRIPSERYVAYVGSVSGSVLELLDSANHEVSPMAFRMKAERQTPSVFRLSRKACPRLPPILTRPPLASPFLLTKSVTAGASL